MTNRQLSFGVERDVLVDELQFYFDSAMAAQMPEEELEPGDGMILATVRIRQAA